MIARRAAPFREAGWRVRPALAERRDGAAAPPGVRRGPDRAPMIGGAAFFALADALEGRGGRGPRVSCAKRSSGVTSSERAGGMTGRGRGYG
jgi:hypothetical protein